MDEKIIYLDDTTGQYYEWDGFDFVPVEMDFSMEPTEDQKKEIEKEHQDAVKADREEQRAEKRAEKNKNKKPKEEPEEEPEEEEPKEEPEEEEPEQPKGKQKPSEEPDEEEEPEEEPEQEEPQAETPKMPDDEESEEDEEPEKGETSDEEPEEEPEGDEPEKLTDEEPDEESDEESEEEPEEDEESDEESEGDEESEEEPEQTTDEEPDGESEGDGESEEGDESDEEEDDSDDEGDAEPDDEPDDEENDTDSGNNEPGDRDRAHRHKDGEAENSEDDEESEEDDDDLDIDKDFDNDDAENTDEDYLSKEEIREGVEKALDAYKKLKGLLERSKESGTTVPRQMIDVFLDSVADLVDEIQDNPNLAKYTIDRLTEKLDKISFDIESLADDIETEDRLQKIKGEMSKSDTKDNIKSDNIRHNQSDHEAAKAAGKLDVGGKVYTSQLRRFSADIEDFVSNEIGETPMRTWSRPDRRYIATEFRHKGIKNYEVRDKVPTIGVYIDQSGSWGPEDIQRGKNALACLQKFQEDGLISLEFKYFGNYVSTSPSNVGGGTGAGARLIDDIKKSGYDNVVVMTDNDFDKPHWPEILSAPKIKVDGAVWFLWRYDRNDPVSTSGNMFKGVRSQNLLDHLKGRAGTKEYIV